MTHQAELESHLGEIFDSHGTIVLDTEDVYYQEQGTKKETKGRTTERKERPIAINTLLLASSGCNVTWGNGNKGIEDCCRSKEADLA